MDHNPPEFQKDHQQRVYDSQIARITKNRARLTATRPHCAALFDLLFPQAELQAASPASPRIPGQFRRLGSNMDEAYRTASLLSSATALDGAIKLVSAVSEKRAGSLNQKQDLWKKAGALKTIPPALTAPGRLETMDYLASRTKYFASLFALNEIKAHQEAHVPGFRWDKAKFIAVLASAEKPMRKIVSQNLLVDQYLDIFLLEQIKNADPNAVGNVGIDPILPAARAILAKKHIEMATANPEYLEELVLLDLAKQRGNIEASSITNPHHLKVVKRMQVVFQAALSLGLEK